MQRLGKNAPLTQKRSIVESTSNPLNHHLATLHSLNSIEPGTYIRLDRDGHFIPTATPASNIIDLSFRNTVEQITKFATDLISAIQNEKNANLTNTEEPIRHRTFRLLILVNQRIIQAIRGKVEGGRPRWSPKDLRLYSHSKYNR